MRIKVKTNDLKEALKMIDFDGLDVEPDVFSIIINDDETFQLMNEIVYKWHHDLPDILEDYFEISDIYEYETIEKKKQIDINIYSLTYKSYLELKNFLEDISQEYLEIEIADNITIKSQEKAIKLENLF
ncbi:MAG: hypothetical protein JHC31_08170 [Sulfurihydrogenibium sp.]|nr:hypothetical protein [Sulfurihydrogenibium sp.]